MAELNSQAPRRHAQANKRRHPKAKPRNRFRGFVKKFVAWCLVLALIGGAVGYFGLHGRLEALRQLGRGV